MLAELGGQYTAYSFKSSLKKSCLEGQGDLVSRLITPKTHIVILIILISNLLTKSL